MTTIKIEGWFSVDHIDLTDINGFSLLIGHKKSPLYRYGFELHLGAPGGKLLGIADLLPDPKKNKRMNFVSVNYSFAQSLTDGHFHDLYSIDRSKHEKENQEMKLDELKIHT